MSNRFLFTYHYPLHKNKPQENYPLRKSKTQKLPTAPKQITKNYTATPKQTTKNYPLDKGAGSFGRAHGAFRSVRLRLFTQ